MAENHPKHADDRRYAGEHIDIIYNLKRCIHAAYCVDHLAQVFDKTRRPWINPDGATAQEITDVIHNCPSGALQYERQDGGGAEATPTANTLMVRRNGPLQISGDLHLNSTAQTRMTLCRCGASQNKPFCDNAHIETGFSAHEPLPEQMPVEIEHRGGTLTITPQPNGSLQLAGNLTIKNEAGNTLYSGTKTALCRCGGSSNKPFCDGTHLRNQFKAD